MGQSRLLAPAGFLVLAAAARAHNLPRLAPGMLDWAEPGNVAAALAPGPGGIGRVTIVMVSAMIVGRITVTGIAARDVPLGEHRLDVPVDKGEELGVFHLGSTAVVLIERAAH